LKSNSVKVPLREQIIQRVKAENPRTVRDLFEIVRMRRLTLSEEDFVRTIGELKENGMLELGSPAPKLIHI